MPPATKGTLGNLPAELTQFVGRRREATEVRALLSDSRLVTLTGIGGVGKTRLSMHVAQEVGRAFDDGVWIVELGRVREAELVPEAVASALRLRGQAAQAPMDQLIDFVATRNLLLVLDNCEHLIDAAAALAESLLKAAPRLRILATSREPLGIGGETVVPVPPLSVPDPSSSQSLRAMLRCDAVSLFVERARSAVPGFELTEATMTAVAEICQRLEGLPLPIELTAARLRAMSVEQILERLTDRYRLLTLGSRGAPTRQQTLRQCIDWSYDLLTEPERELWARLTVFAGGFELEAAEEICGEGLESGDVLDLVSSLVDKSILIREDIGGAIRYRMLETLREYGREHLNRSGDAPELRRRHRNWFGRLALRSYVEWIGPKQLEWLERLDREQANLREAMEFSLVDPDGVSAGTRIAASLYEYWVARLRITEARYWFGRTLARSGGHPIARAMALCEDTVLAAMQIEVEAGRASIEEARRIAAEVDDESLHALVSGASGLLALFSGDFAGAVTYLEAALPVFEATGDVLHQVSALLALGAAKGLAQQPDLAADCQEQARRLTEERGESVYRSYSLCQLGYTAVERGDLDRGPMLVKEGLRLTQLIDDRSLVGTCLATLAFVAAEKGQSERAAVLVGAATAVGESEGKQAANIIEMFGHYAQAQQYAAKVLSSRAYEAAVGRGHEMDLDAVVAFALEERRQEPRKTSGPAPVEKQVAPSPLTKREQQIAGLVAQGLTNRAIADKLVLSQRTVEWHVEHVLSKLQFTTRAQIAAWVVEREHG